MKAIVDIGNTKTKVGVFDGKALLEVRAYRLWRAADWQALRRDYPIDGGLLCTVSGCPDWAQDFRNEAGFVCWDRFRPDWRLPVRCRYDLATLGRDRIAIGAALQYLYPGQTVLGIGLGTCITYNLMRADGWLEPGAIAPGVYMRGRAMHEFTYALPQVTFNGTDTGITPSAPPDPAAGFGPSAQSARALNPTHIQDTESALLAGVLAGVRFELEGFIECYRRENGAVPVVLAGGDTGYFEFSTKKGIFANPNLGLVGLNEILDFNQ